MTLRRRFVSIASVHAKAWTGVAAVTNGRKQSALRTTASPRNCARCYVRTDKATLPSSHAASFTKRNAPADKRTEVKQYICALVRSDEKRVKARYGKLPWVCVQN